MAAEYAVDNMAMLSRLLPHNRDAAVDAIKNASKRYTEKASALGTQIHAEVERLNGEEASNPWLSAQANHFKRWQVTTKAKIILSEATVYNRREGYAGTMDFLAEIEEKNILVDVKSGKSVYPEVALQLCAYAHGEFVGVNGKEMLRPRIDGAAVLHLRPRSYKFIPVRIDEDIWQAFRYIKEAWRWQSSLSKTVLNQNGDSSEDSDW